TIIWAVMISVTLLGLAAGYALGGYVSRARVMRVLPAILMFNAAWLVVVSWFVRQLPATFARADMAVNLTVILFTIGAAFFVPSVLFGMLSPLAITLLTADQPPEITSRIVGHVYALSTAGSVLGALCAAFLFIPWVGLATSLQVFALAL